MRVPLGTPPAVKDQQEQPLSQPIRPKRCLGLPAAVIVKAMKRIKSEPRSAEDTRPVEDQLSASVLDALPDKGAIVPPARARSDRPAVVRSDSVIHWAGTDGTTLCSRWICGTPEVPAQSAQFLESWPTDARIRFYPCGRCAKLCSVVT